MFLHIVDYLWSLRMGLSRTLTLSCPPQPYSLLSGLFFLSDIKVAVIHLQRGLGHFCVQSSGFTSFVFSGKTNGSHPKLRCAWTTLTLVTVEHILESMADWTLIVSKGDLACRKSIKKLIDERFSEATIEKLIKKMKDNWKNMAKLLINFRVLICLSSRRKGGVIWV